MTPLTHRPAPDLVAVNEGVLETVAAVGGLSVGVGFAESDKIVAERLCQRPCVSEGGFRLITASGLLYRNQ